MSSKSASMDRSSREAKLAAIRKQNAADKRRQRIITIVTVAVIVALVAAVAIAIVFAAQQRDEQSASDPAGLTTVANADGDEVLGFAVGPEDAEVTLTLFEDYLCPACAAFEQQSGAYIDSLPDDGVRVVYHPVAFLDRQSPDRYSTRTAGAMACVADDETDDERPVLREFNALLFAGQPGESTGPTLTDEQLAELAGQAGASQDAQQCIVDGSFEGWAQRSTQAAQQAGVSGTPTVWVNGERVGAERSVATQPEMEAAIAAARGEGGGDEPAGDAEPTG
ncbi:MAG: DsbA family protein [Kineosporiaceae bacterium]